MKTRSKESKGKLTEARHEVIEAKNVEIERDRAVEEAKEKATKLKMVEASTIMTQDMHSGCVAEVKHAGDAEKARLHMTKVISKVISSLNKCSRRMATRKKYMLKPGRVTLSKRCGATSANLWRIRKPRKSKVQLPYWCSSLIWSLSSG